MNAVLWLVAGAILGWVAFEILRANIARGMIVSMVIGAMSAYFGGSVLAPLFAHSIRGAAGFSLFALGTAIVFSAACLLVSNLVAERLTL
jgi:uncharacterized membrane protein YeaQ/YmgE (transglycosylase-associated protein family)